MTPHDNFEVTPEIYNNKSIGAPTTAASSATTSHNSSLLDTYQPVSGILSPFYILFLIFIAYCMTL